MEINLKNKKTLPNSNNNKPFSGRNDAIKFVGNCDSMILKAKRKGAGAQLPAETSKANSRIKKSPLELCEDFIDETKTDEKNINEQISKEYFFVILHYFWKKEWYDSYQTKTDEIVKHINVSLI